MNQHKPLESIKHHVVMYSSGIGSYACAKRVAKRYGTDNLILLFADTLIEDKDNYRFLLESAKNVGGELVVVKDGRTPWDVFNQTRWLSHRSAHCSLELKVKPCRKYLEDNSNKYKQKNTALYFGIDWEEYERMNAIKHNWSKYANTVEAPLCWGNDWLDKNKCLEMAIFEGIKPPRLYELGFSHSNCGGFCVKAGKKHFKNLLDKLPEVYLIHEQKEQEFRANIKRDDIAILREQRNGAKYSITLKEYKERIEQKLNRVDLSDEGLGGCGCFVSD